MINSISNSNQQYSSPSFQATMRSKDVKSIQKFYEKELRNTTNPMEMEYIKKGSQKFMKFLDKIGEGDNSFTLKHRKTLFLIDNELVLTHPKDKTFVKTVGDNVSRAQNKIDFYDELFSEKVANEVLETEKILSNNYEKKQNTSNFLSKLFKKA